MFRDVVINDKIKEETWTIFLFFSFSTCIYLYFYNILFYMKNLNLVH